MNINKGIRRGAALLAAVLICGGTGAAAAGTPSMIPESTDITPALQSEYRPGHEGCYWCTPMDITDEDAVWKMLMSDVTVVDMDQMKQTVLYAEPDENSEPIGMITGASQAVHVLEERADGWTQIETYSTSFFDSKVKNFNAFVTGYIQSSKLKKVSVNPNMGVVIDKLTQRLYFFRDGHLETELAVSTGLYNQKQPYNETRSGEFLIISVTTGRITSDNLICDYALRYNADDYLHEVPHMINKDGTKNFKSGEAKLGTRASHGCIRAQRLTNADGYRMSSLYKLIRDTTKKTKKNVKLVIWEDYAGRQLALPEEDLQVYYNPNGGVNYHKMENCANVKKKFLPLTPFFYSQLDEAPYAKLTACPYCQPTPRREVLEEINEIHLTESPGDVMSFWPH